jgi:hypothetical protein
LENFASGAIVNEIIRGYSFSIVFNDEPDYIQKYRQGIVLYRKHRREKTWSRRKQMLMHRTIADIRIHTHTVK